MNLVKGVAGLIRRTSGYGGEYGVGSTSQRFPVPAQKIKFSGIGDEALLSALWQRYQSIPDKAERQKAFYTFLKQFLVIYKNWEPSDSERSSEAALSAVSSEEYSQHPDEIIIGCSAAHPAEIIVALIEEVTHLTTMVTEYISGTSSSLAITFEGFAVLNALIIMTRSMHNCKVLGYYGGIQKLTTLMKGLEALQLLSCLNLNHNKLGSFTALDPLRFLKSLKVLDISYNEIGAHTVDTRRYLCSSPLSHTLDYDKKFEEFANGDAKVANFWESYSIFRDLNLVQLDIVGNVAVNERFVLFLVKLLPGLKWLDGEELK